MFDIFDEMPEIFGRIIFDKILTFLLMKLEDISGIILCRNIKSKFVSCKLEALFVSHLSLR